MRECKAFGSADRSMRLRK